MNPELQTLVDRLEMLERQGRTWRLLVLLSLLLAVVAVAVPLLFPAAREGQPGGYARFSVVEANRFLLRDFNGRIAGGMEYGRDSTMKVVLGGHPEGRGTAFLEVHENGVVDLTLRGPRRGAGAAGVVLATTPDGSGNVQSNDSLGRLRFRAP